MTLPTDRDASIYTDRPGDQIFAKIKHYLPEILEQSAALEERFVKIIIADLVSDHALSKALDKIGKIIEYQAQAEGIEKPRFSGLLIQKDAERIGKLNFTLNLCAIMNLDVETTQAVRDAEIDRLWGHDKPKGAKEGGQNVLKLSDDLSGVLKDLSRNLNKKGKEEPTRVSDRYTSAANSLARSLRERAKSHSTASKRGAKTS